MMNQDDDRDAYMPFTYYDQDLGCWRDLQLTLWGSDEFLDTWPKQGMMRNGECFDLSFEAEK